MYRGTPEQSSSMKLKSGADLLGYLDRNRVEGAIGFYHFPKDKSASWVSAAEAIIRGSRSRVIPLLMPAGDGWSPFASGQFSEAVLRQYLQSQGILQGVGEITLYQAPLQTVTFDSPIMQTVFKTVNELKGVVMVHLSNIREGGRPTDLAEVDPVIQKYPDTIFLFHATPTFDLVAKLMDKYLNVYYTMDACAYFLASDGPVLYPVDSGSNNAASFLAEFNRKGVVNIVNQSNSNLLRWIKQYPDRIMWGTDFGGNNTQSWHFEDSVTDAVISLSREFIGRLPADMQEKYAYKNAQRVFGRFLTTK